MVKTKRCSKCKQFKQPSEFAPRNDRLGGRQYQCRVCQKKYRQSKKGKQARRKYQKIYRSTEKYKAHRRQYQKSTKYKEWLKKYRKTDAYKNYCKKYLASDKGKKVRNEIARRYNARHPERVRAIDAVKYAVRVGKLPRSSIFKCTYCPTQAQQYHHPSYAPEHRLDVEPVCISCHRFIHKTISGLSAQVGARAPGL